MNVINGIRKYKGALDMLADNQDISIFYLYLDSIWSRIRYGCVLNHYVVGNFYKRNASERKKIFTYRDWCNIVTKVNKADSVHYLKEKVDFNTFFADSLGRAWLYSKSMTFEQFNSFCEKFPRAIVKPMNGLEGAGVYCTELPRTLEAVMSLYDELKLKNLLIEEKIVQHSEMVFGNKSVNTIRVYTVLDDKTGAVTIVKTVVRAGVGEAIVDNSHSGGCAYEIDPETGYVISPYYAADGSTSYIHPGTEICMIGRKIPFWPEVLSLCVEGAKKLPDCRYIGWDVAITEKGPLFIEGNHLPDLDMIEFVGSYGYKDKIYRGLGIWK